MKSPFSKLILKLSTLFSIFLFFMSNANATGVLDPAFGINGRVATAMNYQPQAKAVLIQPDGKIIVVGDAAPTVGAKRDAAFARYNADGTLDTTFGFGGRAFVSISNDKDVVNAAALQPDGKIVVVGSMEPTPGSTNTDFLVIRLNSNGSLDAQFGNLGVVTVNQSTTDIFNTVVVQPNGKIVAAGRTSQNNSEFAAIRFNANGTLDGSFANGGLFFLNFGPSAIDETFLAVALFPNGRILLGGSAWYVGGVDILALLEPNGTLAQDFGSGGIRGEFLGASENPTSNFDLEVLPDGKFLAISRYALRRYLTNGSYDQTFRISDAHGGLDTTAAGTDFAIRSDGRIIVLNQRSGPLFAVAYDNNGRDINRVRDLSGNDIAVQSDNKFVIAGSTTDSFTVTRFISITSPATRIADFDHDEKTDLIISRVGNTVYILRSTQSVTSYRWNQNSGEGVRFIPEDYYLDDPSRFPFFYWRYSGQNSPAYFDGVTENGNITTYQWGVSGDIPVGGDYDGETIRFNSLFRKSTELAVFRPSTGTWWIFNRSNNSYFAVQWGIQGDKPVPADYDYDGITDMAIYRPSTGTWWIRRSSDGGHFTVRFGISSDIPLTGDFDGDGKSDFTVYRPSEGNWYQLLTTEGFRVIRFGLSTDIPVPGDYDGDGRHDIAVFRGGLWYLLQSTEGFKVIQWGTGGDSPVAVRYDQ